MDLYDPLASVVTVTDELAVSAEGLFPFFGLLEMVVAKEFWHELPSRYHRRILALVEHSLYTIGRDIFNVVLR
ncbi:MAG TPA: hypothetical protein VJ256_00115 [Dehalococcoidia bacterium]|nr:hypothetical protein [Dehalococcoidia bacterium]HLB29408.1 hypothetical protein [Dehalococcoidia bacterium]